MTAVNMSLYHVLIVDDTASERLGLTHILGKAMPNVLTDSAKTGTEAKEKAAHVFYDAIIMDYNLDAEELGADVAQAILEKQRTCIIGYTSDFDVPEVVNHCKNAGMVTVLPKKFKVVCDYLKELFGPIEQERHG